MPEKIERRVAESSGVGYSEPVELHDTNRLRIEVVPFFVDRTEGTQFACKILRYDKANGWEQTAISLQAAATKRLYDALGSHLAIADHDTGKYVVLKADGTVSESSELDVHAVASAIEQLLRTDGVAEYLPRLDLGSELAHALRTDLRLRELRDAVAELTNHLREGTSDEQTYQAWCERHSWAFGNAYVVNDKLRSISATDQVDLLLPRHLGGFRDLIELKRPDMPVLSWDPDHRNYFWSRDASRAIGQCHRYLDVLHTEVGEHGLTDSPDVVGYHPRATVVIGRAEDWEPPKQKALHGLNCRLADISVITYDHLLAQARRTLELVEAPEPEEVIVVDTETSWSPDEEPF